MNLANRLKRFEERLGPPPAPILQQVIVLGLVRALRLEEFTIVENWLRASDAISFTFEEVFGEVFGADTPECQDVRRRWALALDTAAKDLACKSYEELLGDEAEK